MPENFICFIEKFWKPPNLTYLYRKMGEIKEF